MNDTTNTEMIRLSDALSAANARVAELEARIAELQPMAECAAIMAVCGYFSRMRGPDFWYIPAEGEDDEDALVLPTRTGACPSSYATQRAFPLYAGSAPVPAVPPAAQADAEFEVLVDGLDGPCVMAAASGPRDRALREAMHYAHQYVDEGDVTVVERVTIAMLAAKAKGGGA